MQTAVVLDPYAQAVLSRRHWGKLAPDLAWEAPGVLGFASTWPQAAGALPNPEPFDWEGGCWCVSFKRQERCPALNRLTGKVGVGV